MTIYRKKLPIAPLAVSHFLLFFSIKERGRDKIYFLSGLAPVSSMYSCVCGGREKVVRTHHSNKLTGVVHERKTMCVRRAHF